MFVLTVITYNNIGGARSSLCLHDLMKTPVDYDHVCVYKVQGTPVDYYCVCVCKTWQH